VYETYEHQNQGLTTPKLAPISLVLPKGINMWVLKIFALPSLRLGLLECPKTTILTLSISNTNIKIWVNVILTHLIVIIHCVHQKNKYFHHILKHVDIALPSSKKAFPCYENEFINNT
jgi:hypothetical protein